MNLIYLPNLRNKSFDTISHTVLSVLHALFKPYDVYMIFNAANSLIVLPLRILGKKIVINTDGLEWKRSKWGFGGKTFYKISERIACLVANRLISDSKGIKEYYKKIHKTESTEIAYGAYVKRCTKPKRIFKLGIKPNDYFLQITRFEPENHPLLTIKAFKKIKTNKKLVLVGGNPYPNKYLKQIESELNDNIILTGFIYDKDMLEELWYFCYAYIHGNSVGGTNPALLQSMAFACFTIAIGVSFNRDVMTDCGIYYKNEVSSLSRQMQWVLDNKEKLDEYKQKAQSRILENYSWEKIADQYEKLFYDVFNGKYPCRPALTQRIHLFLFPQKR